MCIRDSASRARARLPASIRMFAVAQTWNPSARVAPRDLKARHRRVSRAHRLDRIVINVAAPSMPATSNRYAVRSTRRPRTAKTRAASSAFSNQRARGQKNRTSLGNAKGLEVFFPTSLPPSRTDLASIAFARTDPTRWPNRHLFCHSRDNAHIALEHSQRTLRERLGFDLQVHRVLLRRGQHGVHG